MADEIAILTKLSTVETEHNDSMLNENHPSASKSPEQPSDDIDTNVANDREFKLRPGQIDGIEILFNDVQGDGTKSEFKTAVDPFNRPLPDRPAGTSARWIHMNARCLNFDVFTFLAHKLCTGKSTGAHGDVLKVLKTHQEEKERRSNYGVYFDPCCTAHPDGQYQAAYSVPFFSTTTLGLSLKWQTRYTPLSLVHESRTLMQYFYKLVPPWETKARDWSQTFRKIPGTDGRLIVVGNWWFLKLDNDTLLTAATTYSGGWSSQVGLYLYYENGYCTARDLLPIDWQWPRFAVAWPLRPRHPGHPFIIRLFRVLKVQPKLRSLGGFVNRVRTNICLWAYGSRVVGGHMAKLASEQEHVKNAIISLSEASKETPSLYKSLRLLVQAMDHLNLSVLPQWYHEIERGDRNRISQYNEQLQQISSGIDDFRLKLHNHKLHEDIRKAQGNHAAESRPVTTSRKPTDATDLLTHAMEIALQPDILAEISGRYAEYIAELQFRARHDATKALFQDIYNVAEEVQIMSVHTKSQLDFLRDSACSVAFEQTPVEEDLDPRSGIWTLIRKFEAFEQELEEFQGLCVRLSQMTAQQIEFKMESNNKTVLVFTIVTIIFLPLSFISSFFGMNVSDIREMSQGQSFFWAVGFGFTFFVVVSTLLAAFYGPKLWNRLRRKTGVLEDVEKGKFD